ncbi:hypothetical protein AB0P21_37055 [Kribbella sp. NPDC056861]|uniref:hypothetical protein n=1 Tax=Kribbella sp. NPDC056861 TaxID=3154857 RepID=UPI0034339BEC
MSFDRPGLPLPGQKAAEVEIGEDLRAEGVELNPDGELEGLDHPGTVSAGPQPNPPRRPHEAVVVPPAEQVEQPEAIETDEPVAADGPVEAVRPVEAVEPVEGNEAHEPVDDPAHEDPATT